MSAVGQGDRATALLALIALVVPFLGCATQIAIGSKPRFDQLPALQAGVSTRADVLMSLGEPRGYGATQLRPDLEVRQVWMYEYVVSRGTTASVDILLVFLDGDLFDGYLWFSGNPSVGREPGPGGTGR